MKHASEIREAQAKALDIEAYAVASKITESIYEAIKTTPTLGGYQTTVEAAIARMVRCNLQMNGYTVSSCIQSGEEDDDEPSCTLTITWKDKDKS